MLTALRLRDLSFFEGMVQNRCPCNHKLINPEVLSFTIYKPQNPHLLETTLQLILFRSQLEGAWDVDGKSDGGTPAMAERGIIDQAKQNPYR
jgi:hypothetical protein